MTPIDSITIWVCLLKIRFTIKYARKIKKRTYKYQYSENGVTGELIKFFSPNPAFVYLDATCIDAASMNDQIKYGRTNLFILRTSSLKKGRERKFTKNPLIAKKVAI